MNNKNKIKFSIIVPLYVNSERFYKDLSRYKNILNEDTEIIIIYDKTKRIGHTKLKGNFRTLTTNKAHTGPAEKRDMAVHVSRGKYCAFIDDDAYPDPNWLKNAEKYFKSPRNVAVGGPGVTPIEDNFLEKIAGLIYESYFCSGLARYRFVPSRARFVEDYPAYNLIVRRSALLKVGGYANDFYGGEDTFLCRKLIKIGKILYAPDVLVHHHRRSFALSYLRQIANVGLHRGYFAKQFPDTSRRVMYFVPSMLLMGFIGGALLSFLWPGFTLAYCATLIALVSLIYIENIIKKNGLLVSLVVSFGVFLTHVVYGLYFVKGYFTKYLLR